MGLKPGYKQTEAGVTNLSGTNLDAGTGSPKGGGMDSRRIPEEWKLKQIRDVAFVFSGGTPNRKISEYWDGDVPWVTTTLIAGNEITHASEFITAKGVENSSARSCKSGTILMAMYGQGKTRGKVSILGLDATINQACAAIEIKDTSSSKYVLHVLNYMYDEIRDLSNSGGQENLSGGIIKNISIPYPPLKEQHAIATALSDVDALLEGLDRLIAKKRDLKQAAMQQLLTGQTRLPGFERKWEMKRLGDLAAMGSGGTPLSTVPAYYGGDIPWVAISDMTQGGKILESTERNLTTLGFANSAAQMFPAGTVLYAMYASLGECSIAGVPLCSSQAILGIRPKNTLSPEFLYHHLASLKSIVQTLGQQGTQSNLNKGMVQDFHLKLPHVTEQIAIAAVFSDMDAEIESLEQRRAKSAALKQAMMQELLTGRTRLVEPHREGVARA
jgi:type I restriction enzyme S subunit